MAHLTLFSSHSKFNKNLPKKTLNFIIVVNPFVSVSKHMNLHLFPKKNSRKGFTLIMTISLLVLLTLVGLGILSLSAVSLRTSSYNGAQRVARENARMAMMLAIGELQKQAGSDQRSTATANLAGLADGSAALNGVAPLNDKSMTNVSKGLSAVQPGTRYWTGVFSNRDAVTSIFTKTPTASIAQWLVSGASSNFPSPPSITPADSTYALNGSGEVADPTKAVVLVGQNSAGASKDQYVVAPVLEVKSTSATTLTGRYAWWVGDEGVKAVINMPRSLDDNTNYASLSAQRRGWETVSGLAAYPTPTSPGHASLEKVSSLAQAEMLMPGVGDGAGTTPLQSIFHSATADSKGLLVDTLNGGTKVDLTTVLSGTLPTVSAVPTITNYPTTASTIIPRNVSRNIRGPRWSALQTFYQQHEKLQNGSLLVRGASAATTATLDASIAPLISDFRLLLGVRLIAKDGMKDNNNSTAGTFQANPCGKIAISLTNPYSVPLRWDSDLEAEVMNQTPAGNYPARIYPLGGYNAPAYIPRDTAEPAVFQQAMFRIPATTLAPGETKVFTNAGPVLRPINDGRRSVPMSVFSAANPTNYDNCVELNFTSSNFTTQLTSEENSGTSQQCVVMDVRESWQSTLIKLELRTTGSSSSNGGTGNLLRRIERFELDNGYYLTNQRRIAKSTAAQYTRPFPLISYNFQLSQPGMDYKSLMAADYELGQRGSTLRTFTDFNLQATRFSKPITSYNPPPYFMHGSDSRSQLPQNTPGGDTGDAFTRNLSIPRWGYSSVSGSNRTILFTIPQQFCSLAQLQHADLTCDEVSTSIGHQPGNAVGNSYATPFVKRAAVTQSRIDYELIGTPNQTGTNQTPRTYFDISHILNTALWDSYFFSTIQNQGKPINPSHLLYNAEENSNDLTDPVKAASHLLIQGAFNVNSTDVHAWKAFLASAKHFKHKADPTANTAAAFPRSLEQPVAAMAQPTGVDDDSYAGFRRLSDVELENLAQEIVKQVRRRGPFVSLSHFVNRGLATITSQPELTRCGALQFAIDQSGLNINYAGNKKAFTRINATTDRVTLVEKQGAPRADLDGNYLAGRPTDVDSNTPDWAVTSMGSNFGSIASIIADREMLREPRYKQEQGYRSTGIPGWLTQADVLQVIGPSLTTRSDTFSIRSYGEALDPAGNTIARAYCEAVVQRIPNYVDPANPSTDRGVALTPLNKLFGRRFQIVSFRWLTNAEI